MPRYRVKLASLFVGLASLAAASDVPGIWLDVPFVKQAKNGCGAASVSMVMQYWNRDKSPALTERSDPVLIQRALLPRDAGGILASAMTRYLQESGFQTFTFRGEWLDLREHLSKGRPLIVCLKESGGTLHYVVVAGLDWQRDLVFMNDPATRKLAKLDRADFEKAWSAARNWTLLALPKKDE